MFIRWILTRIFNGANPRLETPAKSEATFIKSEQKVQILDTDFMRHNNEHTITVRGVSVGKMLTDSSSNHQHCYYRL